MNNKNDLFAKIFLAFCKHALVSILTILICFILGNISTFAEAVYYSIPVCLFVTNCTTLIMSKMNRILERLPSEEKQD